MTKENFWNQADDEDGEFRDVPEEVNNKNPVVQEPQEPEQEIQSVEEVVEEVIVSEEDEDAENEAALSDARMRLEMGRLYEMVMTNDIFQNMDADPQAIKNVQRGLKRFAKEQMEIMLGMRTAKVAEATVVSSPFNDLEVQVLKKLASAATKGASERQPAPQPSGPQPPPKNTTLTPISTAARKTKPAPAQIVKKHLAQTPAAPVKRQAAPVPAKVEDDGAGLTKPIHEMTAEELEEHNAKAAARQAGRKAALPPNRAPMPSVDQEATLFQQRSLDINPVTAITNAIKNSKK